MLLLLLLLLLLLGLRFKQLIQCACCGRKTRTGRDAWGTQ
jgi:hypothetical protein